MKKSILLGLGLMMSLGSYAQYFTDGDSYFKLQYDNTASPNSCLTGFSTHGGAAYGGGNVSAAGYSNIGSNDAIKFTGTTGSIDACVEAYLYDVYYVDQEVTPEACNAMSNATTTVGIDLSVSKKVKVRAKADVDGTVVQFGLASGANGAYPSILFGPITCNSGADLVGVSVPMTLTTSYADYTLDFNFAEFDAWPGRTSVNLWGLKFTTANAVAYIQTIEFGEVATSRKDAAAVKSFSIYPNPSAGAVSVNTQNKAGKMVVTDMLGSVVKTIETNNSQEVYQMNLDTKGVYFLNFQTADGNSSSEKIIID